MQNTRPQPPPMLQALIIWGALLASQGMIVLVSQTAMTSRMSPPLSAPDQMAQAPASAFGHLPEGFFFAGAAMSLLMAYAIPRLLMKRVKPTFSSNGPISPELMQKILPAWIVRWALIESATLFGFLDSMLNANPSAIYPFAGAALIGFILSFPSEQKLRGL
jgi:hypothetical protein